jgi:hypothetical protein
MEFIGILIGAAALFNGAWWLMDIAVCHRTNKARKRLEAQRVERQRLADRVRLHLQFPAYDINEVMGRGDRD